MRPSLLPLRGKIGKGPLRFTPYDKHVFTGNDGFYSTILAANSFSPPGCCGRRGGVSINLNRKPFLSRLFGIDLH